MHLCQANDRNQTSLQENLFGMQDILIKMSYVPIEPYTNFILDKCIVQIQKSLSMISDLRLFLNTAKPNSFAH